MLVNLYRKKYKKKLRNGINKFLGQIQFGFYGVFALESGVLLENQLEVVRRILSRLTKRLSKIFIRISFFQPLTKKPLKSRMGKGVGVIKKWVSYIKKGMFILEVSSVSTKLILFIYKKIKYQMPIRLGLTSRYLLIK